MMHILPKDIKEFAAWIKLINRMDIWELSKIRGVNRVRLGYRVCDVHFSDDSKFATNRNRTNLKRNARPSLYLPEPILEDLIENNDTVDESAAKRSELEKTDVPTLGLPSKQLVQNENIPFNNPGTSNLNNKKATMKRRHSSADDIETQDVDKVRKVRILGEIEVQNIEPTLEISTQPGMVKIVGDVEIQDSENCPHTPKSQKKWNCLIFKFTQF